MLRRALCLLLTLLLCSPVFAQEAAPSRVAVLFSSMADIWTTAGGEIAITVGESVERGFASEDVILVDGGAGKTIDVERLILAEPDLVIASADVEAQRDAAEICRAAGIPVLLLRVETFRDYLDALKVCTDITGREDLYALHGEAVAAQIETLLTGQTVPPQKILFIRASSSARATKAKRGEDHFACAMLEELGAVNIADSAPILLDGLSFEEILLQDPERIFLTTMGDEEAAISYMQSVLTQPIWQSLTAVREGRVHFLPKDLFQYKPNARWAEAYEYLLSLLSGKDET